jgi:DinB superfamily
MATVHPLLDEIRELLSTRLAGYSAEQLGHHPAGDPSRWSAQQVIEHLAATWRMTIAGIEDRLKKGRPLRTRQTLRQRALQVLICDLGYFPKGMSAPEPVRPSPEQPPTSGDELIARLSATLAAMDTALNRIEPEARGAVVLNHGHLGPMNVQQWRRFHRTHARHHLGQIERALASDQIT